jgi:hypothetical protein
MRLRYRLPAGVTTVRDLRGLPSVQAGVQGTSYHVPNSAASYAIEEYVLVREPRNRHDANAIAVYADGRKFGYVSATKAASLAPHFDRLGITAAVVGGLVRSRGKALMLLPKIEAMRQLTA